MAGLTPEQEAKLSEIEAGKGKELSAAQKAIMLQFGKPIEVKPKGGFRETGPTIEKDLNPDKEAGPARDLPNFPKDLAEDPETKRQKLAETEEEKRLREGAKKLEDAAKKEEEALNQ